MSLKLTPSSLLSTTLEANLISLKQNNVLYLGPDSDFLANLVTVVTGYQGQHRVSVMQPQGVEYIGTSECLVGNLSPHGAVIFMNDILWSYEDIHLTPCGARRREPAFQDPESALDPVIIKHLSRQQRAFSHKCSH